MDQNIPILFLSNVTGDGLDTLKKFLNLLPPSTAGLPSALEENEISEECVEFHVVDNFSLRRNKTRLVGILHKGALNDGCQLLVGPLSGEEFLSISPDFILYHKLRCKSVIANTAAGVVVKRKVGQKIRRNMVLVSPSSNPKGTLCFPASFNVLNRKKKDIIQVGPSAGGENFFLVFSPTDLYPGPGF